MNRILQPFFASGWISEEKAEEIKRQFTVVCTE